MRSACRGESVPGPRTATHCHTVPPGMPQGLGRKISRMTKPQEKELGRIILEEVSTSGHGPRLTFNFYWGPRRWRAGAVGARLDDTGAHLAPLLQPPTSTAGARPAGEAGRGAKKAQGGAACGPATGRTDGAERRIWQVGRGRLHVGWSGRWCSSDCPDPGGGIGEGDARVAWPPGTPPPHYHHHHHQAGRARSVHELVLGTPVLSSSAPTRDAGRAGIARPSTTPSRTTTTCYVAPFDRRSGAASPGTNLARARAGRGVGCVAAEGRPGDSRVAA